MTTQPPPPPPPPAPVPLGPPLRLSSVAPTLARVTRADVQAAQAYWEAHALALPGLLRGVLVQGQKEGQITQGDKL